MGSPKVCLAAIKSLGVLASFLAVQTDYLYHSFERLMKAYCNIVKIMELYEICYMKNEENILLIVNFCGKFCDKL